MLFESNRWFALRVTYGRELQAKEALDGLSIRSFVPMRYEYVIHNRKRERKLVPAVSNLLFAFTRKAIIDDLKHTTLPYLRYIMKHDGENRQPLTVRDDDMENFIRVARQVEEDIRYVNAGDYDLKAGERVRVIGGPFVGTVGTLVKINGARSKRVVVELEGILRIASTAIPVNWLERCGSNE